MENGDTWVVLLVFAGIQAIGLLSAWLVRISEGSRCQGLCQWLFLGCLTLAGLATMASLQLSSGGLLLASAALPMMTLSATCDIGL